MNAAADKYVVVLGGINLDIKAKSTERLRLKDSNPGTVSYAAGGVGRNIAHNLALLGVDVKLMSIVGNDDEGRRVTKETTASGVDCSNIMIADGFKTGTYIALLDSTGEMEAAVSSMEIYSMLTEEYIDSKLELLKNAAFIICDTNIPAEVILHTARLATSCNIPLCLEPVSAAKARKIRHNLIGITMITPNLDELKELADLGSDDFSLERAASSIIEKGVKYVITTLGENGICITDINGSRLLKSFETEVSDVTGAGDSLTAGLIYGMLEYGNIDEACSCGLAAAAITVACKATVSPELSLTAISKVIGSKKYKGSRD
ncbi:MAG: carbohydrate kinase family protein [Bacillota bacterium]